MKPLSRPHWREFLCYHVSAHWNRNRLGIASQIGELENLIPRWPLGVDDRLISINTNKSRHRALVAAALLFAFSAGRPAVAIRPGPMPQKNGYEYFSIPRQESGDVRNASI